MHHGRDQLHRDHTRPSEIRTTNRPLFATRRAIPAGIDFGVAGAACRAGTAGPAHQGHDAPHGDDCRDLRASPRTPRARGRPSAILCVFIMRHRVKASLVISPSISTRWRMNVAPREQGSWSLFCRRVFSDAGVQGCCGSSI